MQALELPSWMNSEPDVLGKVEPRLWTRPLRELTPETSYGYELIDFAEDIGWPFDEWQKWLAIHIGELLPDGRPRFRMVLTLVARQNGKTTFVRVLTLFWMFIDRVPLVIGTSTNRDLAKESWQQVINMAEESDLLSEELDPVHTRTQMGEEAFWTAHGSRYRFSAKGRKAGRSLTINRLVLDELREHTNRDTYNAAVPGLNAVSDAQAIAITNQGDANSVVLDELRESALEFLDTGVGDPRLGIFEWSSPNGADPTDPVALSYANPDLNRGRLQLDSLMGEAIRAKQKGGEALADFKTEYMCQRVTSLDPAIDPDLWRACGTDEPIDLAQHRRSLALSFEVSPEGTHAALLGAVTLDEEDGTRTTHVEVLEEWTGFGAITSMKAALPDVVARMRPRVVGFLPSGPAAAVSVDLGRRKGRTPWPPRPAKLEEIGSEDVPKACMGLADLVAAGRIRYPRVQTNLTAQVDRTQKLRRGAEGLWTFTRAGDKPVDETYALAEVVWLSRRLPVLLPVTGA